MEIIRGPDEEVIGRVHEVPDPADLAGCPVDKFLRTHAGCIGAVLNLLSVLIRTGLKLNLISFLAFPSRDRIRKYDLISVADMRFPGCIGNRSRYVVFSFISHAAYSSLRLYGGRKTAAGAECLHSTMNHGLVQVSCCGCLRR